MVELQPQPTPEGKSNNPSTSLGTSTSLKQIRTFQGDVASALSSQKESLFSIQQTEKLKRASGGTVEDVKEGGGKGGELAKLLLGGLIFIALGSFGAWFAYQEYITKSAPPTIATPVSRLISVQSDAEINFASSTKEQVFAFVSERGEEVASNKLEHFILRRGVGELAPLTTTEEFFAKLETSAPSSLIRAFDPVFMLGTYGKSRFILLKLSSFGNAFPGMLAWEKTMATDIGPLFATDPILKTIGPTSVFKDVISKNKDVRVLSTTGTTTEPVLLYSFFDNRMLIITDSIETLRVVIERLTQELLSR